MRQEPALFPQSLEKEGEATTGPSHIPAWEANIPLAFFFECWGLNPVPCTC